MVRIKNRGKWGHFKASKILKYSVFIGIFVEIFTLKLFIWTSFIGKLFLEKNWYTEMFDGMAGNGRLGFSSCAARTNWEKENGKSKYWTMCPSLGFYKVFII